jgi:hypothetical protein
MPKNIEVVRASNPSLNQSKKPDSNFPRMSNLYLELLENKDKIRPDLVNKEYDPDKSSVYSEQPPQPDQLSESMSTIGEEEEEDDASLGQDNDNDEEEYNASIHEMSSDSEASIYDNVEEEDTPPITDNVRRAFSDSVPDAGVGVAPKLSELQRHGYVKNIEKVIPSVDRLQYQEYDEDQEEEEKRELLFKFDLLRKSYGTMTDIPEFTIHSDIKTMKRTYESILRRVTLDTNVDNYKTYLISAFMIIEFVLGFWLKFDMQGFTQQQILNMKSYERLLIELGEKSYVPGGSEWPVELRLLGLVLINAVFFIVSKLIMKKTGSNIISMINAMSFDPNYVRPKRKMKGPNIEIDDIPDVENLE